MSSDRGSDALWPIELLLAEGKARSRRVLGSRWPESFGSRNETRISSPADLVVLAPGSGELRDPTFLAACADLLRGGLSPDGIAYLIAPAWWRARLLGRLGSSDLGVALEIVHLRTAGSERYLVPTTGPGLRFAAGSIAGAHRTLAAIGARLPGRLLSAAARALSTTGVVLRSAGSRPLLQWLDHRALRPDHVVIRYRWGAKGGTAVLLCFDEGQRAPSRVGKVALSASREARIEAEARTLGPLRAAAVAAGARVPDGAAVTTPSGRPFFVAQYLPGQTAARLLRRRAMRAPEIVGQLAHWLERWNRSTLTRATVGQSWLETGLPDAIGAVMPHLPGAESYLVRLRELAQSSAHAELPLVAAHNDLTMVNVLLSPGMPPAIVDWEMAEPRGLPLADLCYAVVDAFAMWPGANRVEAFARCFLDETPESELVRGLMARAARGCELPHAMVPLCFHACWLRHAANEVRSSAGARPAGFLRIVRLLAERPLALRAFETGAAVGVGHLSP